VNLGNLRVVPSVSVNRVNSDSVRENPSESEIILIV
jgi:hypothetical protein